MRVGADGTRKLADGGDIAGAFEAFQRTGKFIVHQRELETERRRFAVDAVAAADARRELVFDGAAGDDGQELLHIGDQDVRALRHLHGEGGVADVAARQAEVQPARGAVVDLFGDGGGEADDVVVERLLQFLRAFGQGFGVGETFVRAGLHLGEILRRHDALLDERLAGEQFDLQPDLEFVFVGPDGAHFGARIT